MPQQQNIAKIEGRYIVGTSTVQGVPQKLPKQGWHGIGSTMYYFMSHAVNYLEYELAIAWNGGIEKFNVFLGYYRGIDDQSKYTCKVCRIKVSI